MSATFVCGITAPITLYSPSGAQAVSPVGFEHPSQNGHGTRLPSMLRGCLFLNAIWSNVMALSFPLCGCGILPCSDGRYPPFERRLLTLTASPYTQPVFSG